MRRCLSMACMYIVAVRRIVNLPFFIHALVLSCSSASVGLVFHLLRHAIVGPAPRSPDVVSCNL